MKKIIGILTLTFAFGSCLVAAQKSTASVHADSHYKKFRLEGGPGLAMTQGSTAFSLALGGSVKVNRTLPVYVGLTTGFDFLGSSSAAAASAAINDVLNGGNGNVSTSVTYMPLLGSVIYRFENAGYALTPHIGAALGPYIGLSSGAGTEFAFLMKPGADLELTKDLALLFETRLGSVGGNFYFSPQTNLIINL